MNNLIKYSFVGIVVLSSTIFDVSAQESERFFYAPTRLKPSKEINKPVTDSEVKAWADKNEVAVNAAIAAQKGALDKAYRKRLRRSYRGSNWNYGIAYSSRYGYGYRNGYRYPYRNSNTWNNRYDWDNRYYRSTTYNRRRSQYDDFCSPYPNRGMYNRNVRRGTTIGMSNNRVFVGCSRGGW